MSSSANNAIKCIPMQNKYDRVVLLIDMDCFYCQVEEKLDPRLVGQPLAVVQYNAWRGGGIIAVNYAARAKGVTRHMRGDEAKEHCPEIFLVKVPNVREKADLTKYRDAGKEVANVLQRFTPLLERASVDEAYLDITQTVNERLEQMNAGSFVLQPNELQSSYAVGYSTIGEYIGEITQRFINPYANDEAYQRVYEANDVPAVRKSDIRLLLGAAIANEIRAAVKEVTGYTCSAGVAHNKILAKLACGMNKPNKQTILPLTQIEGLFATLPVSKIKGLGAKYGEEVCERLGVRFLGQLLKYTEAELQRKFDEKNGSWLYNISRGIDLEAVTPRFYSKSIGCCKKFPGRNNITGLKTLQHWLHELANEISERLEKDIEENNRRAKQMIVSYVQDFDGAEISSSRSAPLHSYDKESIAKCSLEILRANTVQFLRAGSPTVLRNAIKYLGISVGKFETINNVQNKLQEMFANQTAKQQKSVTAKVETVEVENKNVLDTTTVVTEPAEPKVQKKQKSYWQNYLVAKDTTQKVVGQEVETKVDTHNVGQNVGQDNKQDIVIDATKDATQLALDVTNESNSFSPDSAPISSESVEPTTSETNMQNSMKKSFFLNAFKNNTANIKTSNIEIALNKSDSNADSLIAELKNVDNSKAINNATQNESNKTTNAPKSFFLNALKKQNSDVMQKLAAESNEAQADDIEALENEIQMINDEAQYNESQNVYENVLNNEYDAFHNEDAAVNYQNVALNIDNAAFNNDNDVSNVENDATNNVNYADLELKKTSPFSTIENAKNTFKHKVEITTNNLNTPQKPTKRKHEALNEEIHSEDTLNAEETNAQYQANYVEFAVPQYQPELLQYTICPICKAKIPSNERSLQTHQDQHFAQQLSQQQRLEFRQEISKKIVSTTTKSPTNLSAKKPKKSPVVAKTNTANIMNFFKQPAQQNAEMSSLLTAPTTSATATLLLAENMLYCAICKTHVKSSEMPEHQDYHLAKDLQRKLNQLEVRTVTIIPKKPNSSQRQKSLNSTLLSTSSNKSALAAKSITEFFSQPNC